MKPVRLLCAKQFGGPSRSWSSTIKTTESKATPIVTSSCRLVLWTPLCWIVWQHWVRPHQGVPELHKRRQSKAKAVRAGPRHQSGQHMSVRFAVWSAGVFVDVRDTSGSAWLWELTSDALTFRRHPINGIVTMMGMSSCLTVCMDLMLDSRIGGIR